MSRNIWQVSDLNRYIQNLLTSDLQLLTINIEGEVSNWKRHQSGHFYFSLKDVTSQISCVLFRGSAVACQKDVEQISEGSQVLIEAVISVYLPRGSYSLRVKKIRLKGLGSLWEQFQFLKEKLSKAGLFNKEKKQLIPQFPRRIGIITASTGAAVRDLITTLHRRWPIAEIYLFPTLVQGTSAAKNIADRIKQANTFKKTLDVLIVGRGGGSIEDLWAFNEEIVALAIHKSEIPVISGVGHETDFTIADFVADLRAPTPTAAAELATPNKNDANVRIIRCRKQIIRSLLQNFNWKKEQLARLKNHVLLREPEKLFEQVSQLCDNLVAKYYQTVKLFLFRNEQRHNSVLERWREICTLEKNFRHYWENRLLLKKGIVEKLNPENLFEKGYAYVSLPSKKAANSIEQFELEKTFKLVLKDGMVSAKTLSKKGKRNANR